MIREGPRDQRADFVYIIHRNIITWVRQGRLPLGGEFVQKITGENGDKTQASVLNEITCKNRPSRYWAM